MNLRDLRKTLTMRDTVAMRIASRERRNEITSTRKYWRMFSLSAPERAWGTCKNRELKMYTLKVDRIEYYYETLLNEATILIFTGLSPQNRDLTR